MCADFEDSSKQVVTSLRHAFHAGKTRPLEFRLEQLRSLRRMLQDEKNRTAFLEAMAQDLRKPTHEASLYELDYAIIEINTHIRNLQKWAQNEPVPKNLLALLDTAYVQKQPFGVVLILGAWNYPVQLTLHPAIGAISAGNCAVIKPSELSPQTARVMADILPKYLNTNCYRVILADVDGTRNLLTNHWDYIFCTGSPNVGRAVMAAAAPNLTPVTLELGGKSPCYIDESADFELAAKRILWGKCVNLGQTCIAPDYVLCSKAAQATFVSVAKSVLTEWYGSDIQDSADITRIVNMRHWKRLCGLLDSTGGTIVHGGKRDKADLWIEPTIVTDLSVDDPLMQEEIFGPILPIINVNSVEEAIAYINSKPRPLALYSFAKNKSVNKTLLSSTTSGGVCVNDVVWHSGWNGLPFGGVGNSGMGSYHGKASFDTFTHRKSVLERSFGRVSERLGEARYPPYTSDKLQMFQRVLTWLPYFDLTGGIYLKYFLCILLGAALYALISYTL